MKFSMTMTPQMMDRFNKISCNLTTETNYTSNTLLRNTQAREGVKSFMDTEFTNHANETVLKGFEDGNKEKSIWDEEGNLLPAYGPEPHSSDKMITGKTIETMVENGPGSMGR